LLGLVTLATNTLLTRLLPPEEIGIYFLLFSLVSVLALTAQAGMQQVIVRLVVEARSTGSTHLAISAIRSAYLSVWCIPKLGRARLNVIDDREFGNSPIDCLNNAKEKYDKLEQILRTTATISALPTFFALALFIFAAEPMLRIIYGEYYATGAYLLTKLSLGQLFNVWCGSCGYVLMMTGHQIVMMKISILCGVISVALAFYLVPGFGGLGAAASISVALVVQNLLMLFAVVRYLGIWTQIDIRLLWQQFSRRH